jgi:hydrophobic/amphiphilic exporter-1 (mainly G- bacteria), HAE1 family
VLEAAIEGAKLRLRPILMTALSTAIGLLPLVFATGAGAMGSRTIGTAAVGGMIIGTAVGVILVPGLYIVFGSFSDRMRKKYFRKLRQKNQQPFTETL